MIPMGDALLVFRIEDALGKHQQDALIPFKENRTVNLIYLSDNKLFQLIRKRFLQRGVERAHFPAFEFERT